MGTTRQTEISIIVPFFNAAGTLTRCIESIRRQTFDRFELLLVDNGSTDDSRIPADKAARQDERIRLLRSEEKGVSAARNAGMKEAAGQYITFVDADDLIKPTYLERLLAMIGESEADFAAAGFISFTEEKEFAAESSAGAPALSLYGPAEYITERILRSDNHVWGKLYRKEFLDRAGASFDKSLTIGEDMLFLLHLTGTDMKAVCSEEKLYGYYVNPKGAIERPFTASYLDQVRCWEQAELWIEEHYPDLIAKGGKDRARLISIRVVAEILVASKMSGLPAKERKNYSSMIRKMQLDVADAIRDPLTAAELPAGYGAKTKLFSLLPSAYFRMYGAMKFHGDR